MSRGTGARRTAPVARRTGSGAGNALDSETARRPGPVRTCVGCRTKAAQADLLRVVGAGGVLVPDPGRRLPGRGASVHLDLQCVALADKRRAFPRALRLAGPLDVSLVREHVAAAQPAPVSMSRTSSTRSRQPGQHPPAGAQRPPGPDAPARREQAQP